MVDDNFPHSNTGEKCPISSIFSSDPHSSSTSFKNFTKPKIPKRTNCKLTFCTTNSNAWFSKLISGHWWLSQQGSLQTTFDHHRLWWKMRRATQMLPSHCIPNFISGSIPGSSHLVTGWYMLMLYIYDIWYTIYNIWYIVYIIYIYTLNYINIYYYIYIHIYWYVIDNIKEPCYKVP